MISLHSIRLFVLTATLVMAAACSDPDPVSDGGATDAFVPDIDASSADAGGPEDAGTDAPELEPCTRPGVRERVACGLCGDQARECRDGAWVYVEDCIEPELAECEPGLVEERATARCGREHRNCNNVCRWERWNVLVADSSCFPNEVRCNAVDDYVCDENCTRSDNPDCG